MLVNTFTRVVFVGTAPGFYLVALVQALLTAIPGSGGPERGRVHI